MDLVSEINVYIIMKMEFIPVPFCNCNYCQCDSFCFYNREHFISNTLSYQGSRSQIISTSKAIKTLRGEYKHTLSRSYMRVIVFFV